MAPAFAVTDNLTWTVSKRPLFFQRQNGTLGEWPTKVAIVRDDTEVCLGTVSQNYESVQNTDLLKLIDPMVQEGVLTIENMGYLAHGAKVFAQAKIAQEFQVLGESYNAYITLLNGHVGNSSVAIGPSAYRVICGNTFTMAYADLSERYRHETGVNEKVLSSRSVLNFVDGSMKRYSEKVEKLALTPCNTTQFRNVLEVLFKKDLKEIKKADKFVQLFQSGAGNEGKTFYDALNSITDFNSNVARKSKNARFGYVNFGTGSRMNARAMSVLTEMATV
jgi:phage/plasmid-like protein (TIGR03299 family)